ncbi:hypothetical protein K501DRAFT_280675 [Backusella circina FSU 941]|nr:hypothetical protein K501DRAFT_280675 [Backusella circina FSU 941]
MDIHMRLVGGVGVVGFAVLQTLFAVGVGHMISFTVAEQQGPRKGKNPLVCGGSTHISLSRICIRFPPSLVTATPTTIMTTRVPQTISDALAHRAKVVSEDPDNPTSPFQVRAMHEGLYYQGGKADDISVIVAIVKKDERPPEPSPPPLP